MSKQVIKNQTQTSAVSVLFIDSAVSDYQHLLRGLKPGITAHVLNPLEDGVHQITRILNTEYSERSIQEIHIVSHGSPGCLYLGNTQLSLDTLNRHNKELKAWFNPKSIDEQSEASRRVSQKPKANRFSPALYRPLPSSLCPSSCPLSLPPTLLLYGCNAAAGDAGAEFITKLHFLTRAEIAASTTLIGNAAQGGDWRLDYTTSFIAVTSLLEDDVAHSYSALLAAPTISDGATATRETAEETSLLISGLSIDDTDGGTQTVSLSVLSGTLTLTSTSGLSGITGDGSNNLSFSGSIADINAALNGLSYVPDIDFSGDETLAISVNDGSTTTSQNIAIAVTPVNDAPTIAPSPATAAEGGSVAFDPSNFNITDADSLDVQIIIKIDTLPSKGVLKFGGAFVVPGSTFSADQINQLTYEHDGTQTTAPGGTADSFTVTVDDGAGGTIPATTIDIDITPVNQLPSASGANTLFEGEQDHPVSITISDPDQTAATYDIEILSLPTDGVL